MSICHLPTKAQEQLTQDRLSQVVFAEESQRIPVAQDNLQGSESEWEMLSVPFAAAAEGTAYR